MNPKYPLNPMQIWHSSPYKTVVTRSSSKPHDLYHVKYTEHLFVTNLKAPSLPSLRPLIQKTFGSLHHLSDSLVKSQEFYQLLLTDSQSVTITHTRDEHNSNFIMFSKCIIRRILTSYEWKDPFIVEIVLNEIILKVTTTTVSYTHLTLPTNREV